MVGVKGRSGVPAVTCASTSRSTGEKCGNPPRAGSKVCAFHGGSEQAAAVEKARRDLGLPDATPEEIVRHALNLAAWLSNLALDLSAELDNKLLLGEAIKVTREYGDIIERIEKTVTTLTKPLAAIAALGLADAASEEVVLLRSAVFLAAAERLTDVLEPWPQARYAAAGALFEAAGTVDT
jgi:hypothetical protein